MSQKICLITGANSGIGKAAAFDFARSGHHVILACRSQERGENACRALKKAVEYASIDLMLLDLSSFESILSFVNEFEKKYQRLDVLVHNGACFDYSIKKRTLTPEGFETVIVTNFLAPILLTEQLLDMLKKSDDARIITVGTKGLKYYPFTNLDAHDLNMEKTRFTLPKAYYNSKLALLIYTQHLSRKLKKDNIAINAIEVTNVKLGEERLISLSRINRAMYFIKKLFSISPEKMAQTYSFLAFSEQARNKTGLYFDKNQNEVKLPKKCKDDLFCKLLIEAANQALTPWTEALLN